MENPNKKFINPIYIFQISLLLFCLITFIKAEDIKWVEYNHDDNLVTYTHTSGYKTQIIGLIFEPNKILPYMKVTITPDENTPTPLLCFSSKDSLCNTDRQILSKRTDGLSSMIYIKKEQFQSEDLFILVTCEDFGCGYTVKYEGSEYAEIDSNFSFSYLVTKYNKQMVFQVMGVAEEGSFLTIGVEGSSKATISVTDIEVSSFPFEKGIIMTFPIVNTNSNSLATFTLKGAEEE